jgi:DNA-binding transcriptional regulator YiaG
MSGSRARRQEIDLSGLLLRWSVAHPQRSGRWPRRGVTAIATGLYRGSNQRTMISWSDLLDWGLLLSANLLGRPALPEETTASFLSDLYARPTPPEDAAQVDALVACRQIRAARAMLGWTQSDLGRALGVDQRQVRFWERRLPSNRQKRRNIVLAFAAAGIEFTGTPAVGVFGTAKERI